jgi:ABC-2 type transport system ATP-binding protein
MAGNKKLNYYCIETHRLIKHFPLIKGYRDLLLHPFSKREVVALRGVNLQIKPGELFGLLGTNGAGKTTLLKILCTLVLPTSGRALVQGLDVTQAGRQIRRLIGYVHSDERSFYWRLTGRQNLQFFARLNNLPKPSVANKINALLAAVGLSSEESDRLFKDYSTGMRKKLAIARGLLTDPDIIFMDEPANGLDPLATEQLRTLIQTLVKNEHKTVVLATHDLYEAEALCDRIAILSQGEVKLTGTVAQIKKAVNPAKHYVIRLENFDAVLRNRLKELVAIVEIKPVNGTLVELEVIEEGKPITALIEIVIGLGGKVSALYEKQTRLAQVFHDLSVEYNE